MDAASTLAAIAGAFLLAGFVKGVIGLDCPPYTIGCWAPMTPAQAAAVLGAVARHEHLASGSRRRSSALARRLWPRLQESHRDRLGSYLGDDNGRATVWLGVALAVYAVLG
jgi:hypothetical protein